MLVDRIQGIGPLVRERAVIADRNRFLPQEAVDAFASAIAWHISALRRYGGYEGASMCLAVARTVGYYDPVAVWRA